MDSQQAWNPPRGFKQMKHTRQARLPRAAYNETRFDKALGYYAKDEARFALGATISKYQGNEWVERSFEVYRTMSKQEIIDKLEEIIMFVKKI